MISKPGLDADELQEAAAHVRAATPDIYKLKDLYGAAWKSKARKNAFGTRFKATVEAGMLDGVTFLETTSQNHALYLVHGQ